MKNLNISKCAVMILTALLMSSQTAEAASNTSPRAGAPCKATINLNIIKKPGYFEGYYNGSIRNQYPIEQLSSGRSRNNNIDLLIRFLEKGTSRDLRNACRSCPSGINVSEKISYPTEKTKVKTYFFACEAKRYLFEIEPLDPMDGDSRE